LLADPFSLGDELVAWTPPAVPPETATLRAGLAELEGGLQPASPGHMTWCLNKLFVLPTRDGLKLTSAFQADNFIDVCGEFANDLWTEATIEILKTKTFRPTPAEMLAIVGPKAALRRRMVERIKIMISGKVQLEKPKPFVREPEDVRLRTVRDGWFRVGDVARANKAEARLAEIENRAPVFFDEPPREGPIYLPAPPVTHASVSMQARLNLALAEEWRKRGNKAYADRLEADARALAPEMFIEHRDVPEMAQG